MTKYHRILTNGDQRRDAARCYSDGGGGAGDLQSANTTTERLIDLDELLFTICLFLSKGLGETSLFIIFFFPLQVLNNSERDYFRFFLCAFSHGWEIVDADIKI